MDAMVLLMGIPAMQLSMVESLLMCKENVVIKSEMSLSGYKPKLH